MRKPGFRGSIFLSAILFILSGCGKTVLDHEGTEDCILLYTDNISTDDVVIFNTHNGAVVDVLQTPGKKRGEEISRLIVSGDEGSVILITTYETRKMSRLNCSSGANSWMEYENFEDLFCPKCKGNIYHGKYECGYEKRKIFDIALLDMKTGMIYPVTDAMQEYFIRDFYVQVSIDSEYVNIRLIYNPVS